ncbi:hypothetical protein [Cryobacterium sp. 10C3]|uniref:hypothetical protein n=1 Tax=Cryobacterium sp. 10C3 TaxID=3048577 RepID=UPI002AB590D3|nr:hypothetical protein [Cryobacterium sp. 10C3]MDY7555543.1 hypothetical protein [Cryobacterium sp. 10C3]
MKGSASWATIIAVAIVNASLCTQELGELGVIVEFEIPVAVRRREALGQPDLFARFAVPAELDQDAHEVGARDRLPEDVSLALGERRALLHIVECLSEGIRRVEALGALGLGELEAGVAEVVESGESGLGVLEQPRQVERLAAQFEGALRVGHTHVHHRGPAERPEFGELAAARPRRGERAEHVAQRGFVQAGLMERERQGAVHLRLPQQFARVDQVFEGEQPVTNGCLDLAQPQPVQCEQLAGLRALGRGDPEGREHLFGLRRAVQVPAVGAREFARGEECRRRIRCGCRCGRRCGTANGRCRRCPHLRCCRLRVHLQPPDCLSLFRT